MMLFLVLPLLYCADRSQNECNCNSQRYERKVIKNSYNQNVIYASEWIKIGFPEKYYLNNCADDGKTIGSGSTGANLLPDGNYSVIEYEIKLNCK